MASIRFEGADRMSARIRQIADRFPDRVAGALLVETEIEAAECKRRTPVDTGALRNSIHVVGPSVRGRTISTAIVAGGPAAPYALIVHEDLDAFHPTGEAKYIERPLMESAPNFAARVGRRAGVDGGPTPGGGFGGEREREVVVGSERLT